MHFWNKLSTAALMRLTVLTSLNLTMLRLVGQLDILLHPWFFLSMVTLDLGLYSVMVHSGTLNKTLIGIMLGGLAATLGTLVYTGMGDPFLIPVQGSTAKPLSQMSTAEKKEIIDNIKRQLKD